MSESDQHKLLKEIALIKLHYMGCHLVYPEVSCSSFLNGIMDAVGAMWGYKGIITIGIEVKVSRADFFGSKQKTLAKCAEINKTFKDGLNRKYFLTPTGLVKKEEVYPGWGLLEFNGKRVNKTLEGKYVPDANNVKTLFSMASIPHHHYHCNVSNLMDIDWTWSTYDLIKGNYKEPNDKN